MNMMNYPYAERHPLGMHGVLLAVPLSLALWALLIAVVL